MENLILPCGEGEDTDLTGKQVSGVVHGLL